MPPSETSNTQAPQPVVKQTRRRSANDKNEFKEELIEIAKGILTRDGADAVTLRGISDAAGISPMAIYRYFPSKGILASHLRDYILLACHTGCVELAQRHRSPYAKIAAYVEAYLDYWIAHQDHFRFVYLEPGLEPDSEMKRTFWSHARAPEAMWTYMSELLHACWKLDKAEVQDTEAVMLQMAALQTGLLHYSIVNGNSPLAKIATMRAHSVLQVVDLVRRAPVWTKVKLPRKPVQGEAHNPKGR
ncbi:TetR/AcrR family transcriptional regulator [Rhodoferax aquaticus]|nr:TetR/AcrR family transcriptional regulator [Rhodoferax aquaticus]